MPINTSIQVQSLPVPSAIGLMLGGQVIATTELANLDDESLAQLVDQFIKDLYTQAGRSLPE
jgi:hypothetical protein